tara:strand:+ start:136 stop:816 length:681 start_codon:yes stop_codon:yes gene_type:complete
MFSLSNDKSRNLILNELIDMDFKKYDQLTKRPKDIKNLLIKDYYLPGKTIYSPLEVNFPYSITLMRLFYTLSNRFLTVSTYVSWHPFFDFSSKLKIRKNLENIAKYPPSYTDYSIELNKKILYRFTDQCRLRKIKCYIIKLPYIKDFNYKWESPIEKNLKIDQKLNKYFLTIPRECIVKEFDKRGIKEEEINKQLAKYMHYNSKSSSVIAKCIGSLISSEKSNYEF